MKLLGIMNDNLINKSYKLYTMNAIELSERLKKTYGLTYEEFQYFNSEAKLAEAIYQKKQYELSGKSSDFHEEKIEVLKENVSKNKFLSRMTQKGIEFGYELMPIVISTSGEVEDAETPVELVDGFKRMLSTREIPNVDVLVKVYTDLNDREWINSMMIYNSWKFVDGHGTRKYMDRGFQLGLSYRYGINFIDMVTPDRHIMNFINIYTSSGDLLNFGGKYDNSDSDTVYQTFWNNDLFHQDIKAIYEMLIVNPTFKVIKKGKEELTTPRDLRYNNIGLGRLIEVFISVLGKVRKNEWRKELETRSPFDMNIFYDYLADKDNQKHLIKISTMIVDGHIINYIKEHMHKDITRTIVNGMGYQYKE